MTSNFRYRPILKIAHNGHGGHICAAITEKQDLLNILGKKLDDNPIKMSNPIFSWSAYPMRKTKII